MRRRISFVTNSSSTSFLFVSSKKDPNIKKIIVTIELEIDDNEKISTIEDLEDNKTEGLKLSHYYEVDDEMMLYFKEKIESGGEIIQVTTDVKYDFSNSIRVSNGNENLTFIGQKDY